MAFPIIPKKRSGSAGNPTSLQLGELAVNCATGELFLGGDGGVMLLNPPTSTGTTVTEHTGDGSTVAFTFTGFSSTADGAYLVSVGGIDQPPSKYSISNTAGGTLTFVDPPVDGELISIRAIVAGSGGGGGADIGGRAWSNTATYSEGDLVATSQSETWICIQNSNTGNDPATSPSWWDKMPANAVALRGQPITSNPFQNGDFLYFNGSEWAGSGINTGNATSLQNYPISNSTPVAGNLLRFDGTNWAPFSGISVPNWNNTTNYSAGDYVFHNGKIFYVKVPVAAGIEPNGIEGGYTELVGVPNGAPQDSASPVAWRYINTPEVSGYIPIYQ